MSKENCEREARQKIAASIGALPEEIYFTSGRADGHRKVLKAVIRASKKARPHVIITTMEDPEVLDECTILERKDAIVTYLDPITTGRVEVAMIENELKENTELVSVTAANCQTGTSEPFTGIGTLTSQKGMIFHTDAAFAFGKMPINVEKSHIDMLTADASYFGGPENAGFLYVRKTTGAGEYVSETALSEEVLDEMSTMAEDLAANAATFMEEIRPVRNHLCERIFTEIEDVELNAKWYQEELGFKVAGKFPGMGGRNVYFLENPQDGKMYEISQRDQLPGGATTRIDHIAYRSSDLEKDYEYCKENGYKIVSDGIETSLNFWEKGSRCFKIESACGEVIEICQKIQ